MKRFALFLWLCFGLNWAGAQPALTLSPQAQVSVLTCGPAPEIYALFGHTALRISDPSQAIDVVFNFGTFDFNTPHFALQFVKGDLQYFLSVDAFGHFLEQYRAEGRSVREQVLALTPSQKQQMWERLLQRLNGPDKYYTYRFIQRNCTRLAMDEVEAVVPHLRFVKTHIPGTYRNQIFPYFHNYFWENFGISLVFGRATDQASTLIFLPDEWEASLRQIRIDRRPLAGPSITWVQGPPSLPNEVPWLYYVGYTAVIVGGFYWSYTRKILLWTAVLLSLVCLGVGVYSDHPELQYNPQCLLFNPLWLLVVLGGRKNGHPWLFYAIVCPWLFYGIWLMGKPHGGYMYPWWLGLGWVLWKGYQQQAYLLSFVKQHRV